MKRAKKYAFGGFGDNSKPKIIVNNNPQGNTDYDTIPSYLQYFKATQDGNADGMKSSLSHILDVRGESTANDIAAIGGQLGKSKLNDIAKRGVGSTTNPQMKLLFGMINENPDVINHFQYQMPSNSKDIATVKPKMATGGTVGLDMVNAGKPILDGLMSLLDGNLDYSTQPIVNASTIKNMATPYSKFAMGGTVDDLSEDELYQLQEEADQRGITVEELLQEKQDEGEQEMTSDPEEDPQEPEQDGDQDDDGSLASQFQDEPTDEYAMGGRAKNKIEVEGNEVMEHPDGNLVAVNGPSHENGGVDVSVPNGTKIYSDRLSVDGKTMQERKVRREKNLAKLQKLTVDNASVPLKNTLKRTSQIHEMEDQQDMALQEIAKQIYNQPQSTQKAAYGGTIRSYRTPTVYGFVPTNLPTKSNMTINPSLTAPKTSTPVEGDESNLGIGDYVGLAGNLFNSLAPIVNTNNAARATKPVVNRFKGFGKDALDTNQSAQDYLQTEQTNANNDIDSAVNSQIVTGRNGARSVNTARALNIAANVGRNKARNNVNNVYSQQMRQTLAQRSQLQNQRDAYEDQGQTAADTANAQNLDNYYSNMADNLTNFGTNIQGIGKSLNVNKRNNDDMDLLGLLSKNGIKVGRRKGKLTIVNS